MCLAIRGSVKWIIAEIKSNYYTAIVNYIAELYWHGKIYFKKQAIGIMDTDIMIPLLNKNVKHTLRKQNKKLYAKMLVVLICERECRLLLIVA